MGKARRLAAKSSDILNAYSLLDLENLSWDVAIYTVQSLGSDEAKHEDRKKIKDVIWDLRSQHKQECPGYGFVIDLDEKTVVVPQAWKIPQQDNFNGYRVTRADEFKASACDQSQQAIIAGILREAVKRHFKDNQFESDIGPLWQDYNDFCQLPDFTKSEQGIVYCRKFHVSAELLRDGLWVLQIEVTTTGIDGRTFEDYYAGGEVQQLAEMIQLKQANRLTRENKPVAVRVWCSEDNKVLELETPEEIRNHAELAKADQADLANGTVHCKQYKKEPREVPLGQVRLIPDSQTTQERHSETLIDPHERMQYYSMLRNFLNGMEAYEKTVFLAERPVEAQQFEHTQFLPPKLRVNPSPDGVDCIPAPKDGSPQELKDRRRKLSNHVRNHGYLQQRPINPLLAYPKSFGEQRAKRLKRDLNGLVAQQGLNFRFDELCCYENVHDTRKKVEQGQYDTLFVVLPDASYEGYSDTDTHERIKKAVPIPSQCIYQHNTLPQKWVDRPWRDFKTEDPRHARQINDLYQQCILNLLVKHHWVPFAPAEPFHYNVHVGIDVGGKHNNRVMVCVGYGFMQPAEGLTFLVKEVDVPTQKVEPIPADYLYNGLLSAFDELYDHLRDTGIQKPDFNRTLFSRDGELRGQGKHWHEKDAFNDLCEKFRRRKWIDADPLWTMAEISKRAANWRVLSNTYGAVENPTVGKCCFPFELFQNLLDRYVNPDVS